jgi:hypothetical protein
MDSKQSKWTTKVFRSHPQNITIIGTWARIGEQSICAPGTFKVKKEIYQTLIIKSKHFERQETESETA